MKVLCPIVGIQAHEAKESSNQLNTFPTSCAKNHCDGKVNASEVVEAKFGQSCLEMCILLTKHAEHTEQGQRLWDDMG